MTASFWVWSLATSISLDIGSFPIPQAHRNFTFVAICNTLLNCFDFIALRQAWQSGWAQWAWPCSLVFWQAVWDCNDSRSRSTDIGYGKFRVFGFPIEERASHDTAIGACEASITLRTFPTVLTLLVLSDLFFSTFHRSFGNFLLQDTLSRATRFGMGFGRATPRAGDAGPELGGGQLL